MAELEAPPTLKLLIRLLAQTDALWIPMRDPSDACWAHVWAMRGAFRRSGIAWRAGGSESARKSSERQLRELSAARLVRIYRAGGRASSVRLTFRGDAIGRALAHLRPVDYAVDLMEEMHSLRDDDESSCEKCGDHIDERPWLPETAFTYPERGAGWGDGNTQALSDVNHRFALPVVLGWAESMCDTKRHVRYRLLPEGLRIATGETKPAVEPPDVPERQDWAEQQYDEERAAARGALWSISEYVADIGKIPHRASFMTKGALREYLAKQETAR